MADLQDDESPLLKSTNESDGNNEDILYYDSFPRVGNLRAVTPLPCDPDDSTDVSTSIQNGAPKTQLKVYKRRWYILIMFSLFSNVQNFVWNTWGPISNSSELVFGWNDSTIAWLNNWGPISYIVSGFFFSWLLQVKGLRWAILSSSILTSLGCSLRVITSEASTATILIHAGQFLNGLAGPMAMGAVPQISASWFPVNERVTATAISTSISVFGNAVAFVLGPALVSDQSGNSTANSSHGHWTPELTTAKSLDVIIDKEKEEIMRYMYYSCGFSWLITLIILIYFPAKPPLPPCVSAVIERDKFWQGMWSLRKKGYFIVIAMIYGISLGVVNVWSSVLNVNLRTVHVSETTSGWIGFYATVSLCLASLLVGRFADYFARQMKLFILVMYIAGLGLFVTFSLMLIGTIPYSEALLYGSIIGGMTAINGAVPLMFELACELAFPTSEGSANGVLTYINNLVGMVFLAIFSVPNIGTMWMNWTAIGATAVPIPLIGLMRGRMKRLELDEGVKPDDYLNHEVTINADKEHTGEAIVS